LYDKAQLSAAITHYSVFVVIYCHLLCFFLKKHILLLKTVIF